MRQHCDQRLPRDRRRSRSGLGRTVPDRGLCARNGRVAEGRAVEVQERACLVDLRPVIGESAWVRETLCPETELAHGRRERVVPPTELRLGKAEVAAQTGGPCAERARGAGALLITAAYRAPSKARFLKAVSRGARARRRIAARGPPLREPCGNAFSAAVARASCSRCLYRARDRRPSRTFAACPCAGSGGRRGRGRGGGGAGGGRVAGDRACGRTEFTAGGAMRLGRRARRRFYSRE